MDSVKDEVSFKETIGELHDSGLVHHEDLWLVDRSGVLERISNNLLGGLSGDELDGLDNTWDHGVLDTRVFTFGVLSDQHGVDVLVRSWVTSDRFRWSNVGKEVECLSQSQVEGSVTFSNGRGQWTFQGNEILVDRVNGCLWDCSLVVDEDRGHITGLPLDRNFCSDVDLLQGLGDFHTDAVTFDERDSVLTIGVLLTLVLGHLGGVSSDEGSLGESESIGKHFRFFGCVFGNWLESRLERELLMPLISPARRSTLAVSGPIFGERKRAAVAQTGRRSASTLQP